jgi:oligoribonuclease NrnB/cAMP/cGMP phosphodiesterase (DHH superfamily)
VGILVIYHHPCDDGFAAAYCAWRKFGKEAEYFPTNYNRDPPDVTDKIVYILDFSYPKETMEKIFATAQHTTWLDHHKTAFESYLGEVPENGAYVANDAARTIFLDNHRSGAMIAWQHFFPDAVIAPRLIQHVQDNDLWKFELENTKPFIRALRSYPLTFENWHEIAQDKEVFYKAFVAEGKAIDRFFNRQLENIVVATKRPCAFNPLFKGLAANIPPLFQSEAGCILATECGTFGLLWWQDGKGHVNCSLRSNGDYDVSKIAKMYGGGGHRNAAGFRCTMATLQEFLK